MRPKFLWSLIACLLSFTTACTTVYEVSSVPLAGLPEVSRYELPAQLRIDEVLLAAKWERKMMGDTFRIPLGPAVASNAESLARDMFASVEVVSAAGPVATGSVVLVPRIVSADQTLAATAFGDQTLTVVLEWSLTDDKGAPLWVDTIIGQGTTNAGNLFTHKSNARERTDFMLRDLFTKSRAAISESPELRRYAESHPTP